ncbi:hypothetical protein VE04_06916 [Pseudogymnoascus sp. 24MN13]|nr:hypothetical protein VE04_06916 [Pseudogymnoascus sp. 24MN13]
METKDFAAGTEMGKGQVDEVEVKTNASNSNDDLNDDAPQDWAEEYSRESAF